MNFSIFALTAATFASVMTTAHASTVTIIGAGTNGDFEVAFEAVIDTSVAAISVSDNTGFVVPPFNISADFGSAALVSFELTETNTIDASLSSTAIYDASLTGGAVPVSVSQELPFSFGAHQQNQGLFTISVNSAFLLVNGVQGNGNSQIDANFNYSQFNTIFGPVSPVNNVLFDDAAQLLNTAMGHDPARDNFSVAGIGFNTTTGRNTDFATVSFDAATPPPPSPNVVPLPAAGWLLIGSFGVLAGLRRRMS